MRYWFTMILLCTVQFANDITALCFNAFYQEDCIHPKTFVVQKHSTSTIELYRFNIINCSLSDIAVLSSLYSWNF